VKERHGHVLATPDANVLNACRTLFGADAALSNEFLLSLKPNVIKTAFRKKAKETHPDLFSAHDPLVQKRQTELFRVVNAAYDIMRNYCERRDRPRRPVRARPPRSTTAATPSFHEDETGWRYRGTVPERRLEIGRFLYYRGGIPYHVLIKALAWQMRQRPPVGTIARQWGWLNDGTVRAILSHRGQPHLFGERAQQLGFLSSHQARILLAYQRTLQKRLGRYFVEHGHLTHDEMERLAAELRRHNARYPFPASFPK
jgi:hypothetical protein